MVDEKDLFVGLYKNDITKKVGAYKIVGSASFRHFHQNS